MSLFSTRLNAFILIGLLSFVIITMPLASAVTLDEIKNYRPQQVSYHYENGTGGGIGGFSINATFTLEAGYPADVLNIGNESFPNLNFYIPRGADGIDGVGGDGGDTSEFLLLNGSRSMSGDLNMLSHYITNLLTPINNNDAANKGYVDSVNTSMKNYVDMNTNTTTNLSAIYPIGFVVITASNINPNISLNWGEWESLGSGYALVGV